jgi:hypothetical protein
VASFRTTYVVSASPTHSFFHHLNHHFIHHLISATLLIQTESALTFVPRARDLRGRIAIGILNGFSPLERAFLHTADLSLAPLSPHASKNVTQVPPSPGPGRWIQCAIPYTALHEKHFLQPQRRKVGPVICIGIPFRLRPTGLQLTLVCLSYDASHSVKSQGMCERGSRWNRLYHWCLLPLHTRTTRNLNW